MLVPKKNRIAVYSFIFKEGVVCAKKDPHAAQHGDIPVPNLHVMKLCQSLVSRGYLEEKFSWQWYYWKLTDEGIEYLREYLHIPSSIVPMTLKKQARAAPAAPVRGRGRGRGFGRGRGRGGMSRGGYRGPKKDGEAPSNFSARFSRDE
mmetsp:Transcript_82115/g.199073  ORF Transcript_82115/g.199073 Transcript_82115/m.199073 type:complete len:148 (-) Transcript_82115:17-460(-)